jgi:hypothetical protein
VWCDVLTLSGGATSSAGRVLAEISKEATVIWGELQRSGSTLTEGDTAVNERVGAQWFCRHQGCP